MKLGSLFLALLFTTIGHAADVQFSAEIDRPEIDQDESIALKFRIQMEGMGQVEGDPEFSAPDFLPVNSYASQEQRVMYENGSLVSQSVLNITKVLRPSKTGSLKISNLHVTIRGKTLRSPDLIVKVNPPGAGTPPPQRYGGSAGLMGSGKQLDSRDVFVRAELNKKEVYKGEQLIVSYYLYRRVPVLNVEVTKYPGLSGFLKEELDLAVLKQRLDAENIVLNGVAYQRSLLARYATYALKNGNLRIDPMALKVQYYGKAGGGSPSDDPWDLDPFQRFFQSRIPQVATRQSDIVEIPVKDLPAEGRPQSFAGAVGEFSLASAIDRYQLKVNEAVTLTLKVEGHGNVRSITKPELKLGPEIEVFDSNEKVQTTPSGVGQKVFEIVLVPRRGGKITIPSVEMSYFDPDKRQYQTVKSDSFDLQVEGPTTLVTPERPTEAVPLARDEEKKPEIAPLLPLDKKSFWSTDNRLWLWIQRATFAAMALLVCLLIFGVGFGLIKRRRKNQKHPTGPASATGALKETRQLAALALKSRSFEDLQKVYDHLALLLMDAAESAGVTSAKTLSRIELKSVWVDEAGLDVELWEKFQDLIEFSEMVRFSGGQPSVQEQARLELHQQITNAESLLKKLRKARAA